MGHPVVRFARAVELILVATTIIFVAAMATYGVAELALALLPDRWAIALSGLAAFFNPLPHIAGFFASVVQSFSDVRDVLVEIGRAIPEPKPPNPNCKCSEPVDLSPVFERAREALALLWSWIVSSLYWLAVPAMVLLALWAVDRVRPATLDGWYFDRWGVRDIAASLGASVGVAIEFVAWVTFFYLMHALGAQLWTWLSVLFATYLAVWIFALIRLVEVPGAADLIRAAALVLLFVVLAILLRDVSRAVTAAEDGRAAWRSAWTAGWRAALRLDTTPAQMIARLIKWVQETILAWLVGPVHPSFPRQSEDVARGRANERRAKIDAFLNKGELPVLRTEYRLAPGDQRKFREHSVINQVEEEGPPKLVNEFLEFPPGSPMVLKQSCLSEGFEEAVGQFVRLRFERQTPVRRNWWQRLWAFERPEEIIVPLLSRVVDVAILADRHADTLRRETDWSARPFYERIYAEHRPLPFLLRYALRPLIGDGMLARVVIETNYEEVFLNALFGKGALSSKYAPWFGIGIHIQPPKARAKRSFWKKIDKVQPLCRRLKSHVSGVLSARIDVDFVAAPAAGASPVSRHDSYNIMPSGLLADGCPSVVRPAPFPPAASPSHNRIKTPLPPRGSVSNAPPAWLFPAKSALFPDCRDNCLLLQSAAAEHTIAVTQSNIGEIAQRSSLLPRRYRDPDRRWLYRRVWSGAFFDPDLALWNRFPLYGCSYTSGDPRSDLRGALAKTMFAGWPFRWLRGFDRRQQPEREWSTLGGVFVSAQGPDHAANLLLAEPLFYDYLNHITQREAVMTASRAGACKGPAFVPKPPETESR